MMAGPLSFDEALAALEGMLGQDVLVSAGVAGGDAEPAVSLSGELRRADAGLSLEVLQMMGRAQAGDESLMFHVGGSDEPGEQTFFLIRKSEFSDAEWVEGAGHRFLTFTSNGMRFTVVLKGKAEAALKRYFPPED
jgi:hypothetical protein